MDNLSITIIAGILFFGAIAGTVAYLFFLWRAKKLRKNIPLQNQKEVLDHVAEKEKQKSARITEEINRTLAAKELDIPDISSSNSTLQYRDEVEKGIGTENTRDESEDTRVGDSETRNTINSDKEVIGERIGVQVSTSTNLGKDKRRFKLFKPSDL